MLLIGRVSPAVWTTVVAVRAQDAGIRTFLADRPIEAAVNKEAGASFEGDGFDRVTVVAALLVNYRVERGAFRQWIEFRADPDLFANRRRAGSPLVQVRISRGHPRELLDGLGLGLVFALTEDWLLHLFPRFRRQRVDAIASPRATNASSIV